MKLICLKRAASLLLFCKGGVSCGERRIAAAFCSSSCSARSSENSLAVISRVSQSGNVLVVSINRPERRNAVDRSTAALLYKEFKAFESNPLLKVAVLSSTNGTFCSGADLKAIAESADTGNDGLSDHANYVYPEGDLGPMGPTRLELSKPVIAAIEGYCVAGGLEVALWCHMRVAARSAVFGVFCRRFGVPLIDGGTVRLPRIVGEGKALDMILTGRPVNSKEALGMGLISKVVENGSSEKEAIELAEELSSMPQQCMRADLISTTSQHSFSMKDALRRECAEGMKVILKESIKGASRFSTGQGRHGSFKT
eukprot:Nk52_evm63s1073 gene=Nk52_evmTU63s1073